MAWRHGTPNGYANHACRCDPCTWAWASYSRGARGDQVDAAPVWFDEWAASIASNVVLESAGRASEG